jgi:capsular polysaccharide biosynthesis protein
LEDENVFSLRDILHVFRKYMWLILVAMVVGASIALAYSFMQRPQYQASTKVLVGQDSGFVGSNGNVQQLQDLTQTMSQAIRTRPVAVEVIRQQGLNRDPDALLGRITADQIGQTQFIQVTYTDTDPRVAQLVADAVGEVFSEQVSEVSPDVNAVTATPWEEAVEPGQDISPNTRRNIAGGLIGGMILALGLGFLLEYLEPRGNEKGEEQYNKRLQRHDPERV